MQKTISAIILALLLAALAAEDLAPVPEIIESVIVATENPSAKCIIVLDANSRPLASYYLDKSAKDDPIIWHPGEARSIHCSIDLSPFRLSVVETSHGSSVRISRDEKLASMESINFGVHGADGHYAAIVRYSSQLTDNVGAFMASLAFASLQELAQPKGIP